VYVRRSVEPYDRPVTARTGLRVGFGAAPVAADHFRLTTSLRSRDRAPSGANGFENALTWSQCRMAAGACGPRDARDMYLNRPLDGHDGRPGD
jgi:hypothetical protein